MRTSAGRGGDPGKGSVARAVRGAIVPRKPNKTLLPATQRLLDRGERTKSARPASLTIGENFEKGLSSSRIGNSQDGEWRLGQFKGDLR